MTTSPAKKTVPPARPRRVQSARTIPTVTFKTGDGETRQPKRASKAAAPTAGKPPAAEPEPTTAQPAQDGQPLVDPEPEIEEPYAGYDPSSESEEDDGADEEQGEPMNVDDHDDHTDADTPEPQNPKLTSEGFLAEVAGVPVVREQLLYTLGPHAPFRYSILHLENGDEVYACRDCWWTAPGRGAVMQHRNARHGNQYGKKRAKVTVPASQGVLDIVFEPRENGAPVPNNTMDWTLRELLAMVPSIGAMGDLVDRLEKEVRELRSELAEYRVGSRDDERKIAAYEGHRTEILELRRFKNDILKKLNAIGFKYETGDDEE